ncbi:MAG: hypothetical protein ABW067_10375 [Rhizobacter sp.]
MDILIESERRQSQLDFVASGRDVEVGDLAACPLPIAELKALDVHHPAVRAVFDGGLTALVFKVHANGRDWAVKRARSPCLVQGVDGQTSFVNELQRRAELAALKALPGGDARFTGVVDTVYGSLAHGIIVSPWIDGEILRTWDERRLRQVFDTGRELVRAGFFEWDFCPGNLMDDGRQVWLFDFGYMYRFDPLRQFNSAGDGSAAPQCHLAERIESRHAFGAWLDLPDAEALAAFRQEKEIALATFHRLREELAVDGATTTVLAWLDGITAGWRAGLEGDLRALWLCEGWRSHTIDLEDDLHGETCTPNTLRRVDWLLAALRDHHGLLSARGAFAGNDAGQPADVLRSRYAAKRREAEGYQVRRAA